MSNEKYRIEFVKSNKNADNGTVGTLTLFKGNKVEAQSSAFTGGYPGPGLVPIPDETYTIRLDIRGVASGEVFAPHSTNLGAVWHKLTEVITCTASGVPEITRTVAYVKDMRKF